MVSRTPRREGRDWHASMSVALGLGLGFFVLAAVVGVLAVGLIVGYQNTVDLLRQKAELIVSSQREQTLRFLEAAEEQVDFIATQIANEEVEPGRSNDFISLLMGAVAATPQIIRIQYIDREGRLSGVERQLEELLPIFQSVGDDTDLRELIEQTASRGEPFWGNLLWRQEYAQAVLNYQRPLILDGQYAGMISAWISTNQLSEFLSNLESEFGANAFLLHGRDEMLAHPLMAFGYAGLNRATPLPKQATYADPVIAAMWTEHESDSFASWFLTGPGVRLVAFGDLEYVILYDEISGYSEQPWLAATYFEAHNMASEAQRLRWAIIICFLMAVLSASVAAYIGHRVSQPARRLAEGAVKVHDLDLANVERIPRSFFSELDNAAQSFNFMLDGLRWFERYVPKGLVRRLMKTNPEGDIQSSFREVAIMFADIVGYTTLSENLSATSAAKFLNDHFAIVAHCVDEEDGTVDKFIGDSVMAIWGAPEFQDDLADRACRCALAIRQALQEENARRRAENSQAPEVRLRIGVHIGRVVVGNIGSVGRVNYTVVGDAVNVAQRLEEAGKTLDEGDDETTILLSAAVKDGLTGPFDLVPLGPQSLRGRAEQVEVYWLRGEEPAAQPVDITPAVSEHH